MPKKKQKPSPSNLLIIMCICLAVFALCGMVAASRQITGSELSMFRWINNLREGLRPFFTLVTQFGSQWFYFGAVLVLIAKRHKFLAFRFFAVGGATFLASTVLKHAFGRLRPDLILPAVHIRELMIGKYGFPSGHTAMATAMSLVLFERAPGKWRWIALAWIFLVGFSRIYLGAHAPLDIVAGAALGLFMVMLERFFRSSEKPFKKYV